MSICPPSTIALVSGSTCAPMACMAAAHRMPSAVVIRRLQEWADVGERPADPA